MLKPLLKYVFLPVCCVLSGSNAWSASQQIGYDCSNIYKWSSSINFSSGNIVRDKGIAYKAKRQTRAELPNTNSGANGSWQKLGACFAYRQTPCDFNGDGILDVAKGFPEADLVSGKSNGVIPPAQTEFYDAGEVTITYSNPAVDKAADQVWDQNSVGMFAYARKYARFGMRLSAGDYNRDNFCDLAIGSPSFSLDPNQPEKGTVNILYGSPNGLTIHVLGDNGQPLNPYDAQRFDQDSPNVPDVAEAGDSFGNALATGDINGDGFDDLMIGAQGEDVTLIPELGPVFNAGYFTIMYGSRRGLQTSQPRPAGYFQHITGVPLNEVKVDEFYGAFIVSADFDHDGYSDLAISAPEDEKGYGKVSLFRGSPSGMNISSRIDLTLDNFSRPESNKRRFGIDLRTGDFNNDGYVDLGINYAYSTQAEQYLLNEIQILGSASGLAINP